MTSLVNVHCNGHWNDTKLSPNIWEQMFLWLCQLRQAQVTQFTSTVHQMPPERELVGCYHLVEKILLKTLLQRIHLRGVPWARMHRVFPQLWHKWGVLHSWSIETTVEAGLLPHIQIFILVFYWLIKIINCANKLSAHHWLGSSSTLIWPVSNYTMLWVKLKVNLQGVITTALLIWREIMTNSKRLQMDRWCSCATS